MRGLRICLTGANGFIGRRLVAALSRQGHAIRVLSRRSDCLLFDGIHVVKGDLTSVDCPFDQFLEGCEVVVHCAGEIRDVAAMKSLHVDGTHRLLQAVLHEAAQRGQTIHWVQLSSVGAYGPPPGAAHTDRIVTEDTSTRPFGEYEVTKTQSDELVVQASERGLMSRSILRPSNVFGSDMPNQSLRGLIRMVKRGLFFYIGRPGAVANYVHVDDVVIALMKCAFEPKARGQIYNLSNDCLLEDLIKCTASILKVHRPRMRITEPLIRTAVGLFEGRVNIPLTQSRIDALVNKTRYPADKIVSELDFIFSKPMPAAIEDLIKKDA